MITNAWRKLTSKSLSSSLWGLICYRTVACGPWACTSAADDFSSKEPSLGCPRGRVVPLPSVWFVIVSLQLLYSGFCCCGSLLTLFGGTNGTRIGLTSENDPWKRTIRNPMCSPFIHSVETLSLHWSRMDKNFFLDIQRLKRKLNNPGFLPSPKFRMF